MAIYRLRYVGQRRI